MHIAWSFTKNKRQRWEKKVNRLKHGSKLLCTLIIIFTLFTTENVVLSNSLKAIQLFAEEKTQASIELDENDRKESPYEKLQEKDAVIIEVEDEAEEVAKTIAEKYPQVDIVKTYTLIFQALALEGTAEQIKQIAKEPFTRSTHPVVTYTSLSHSIFNQHATSFIERINSNVDGAYFKRNDLNKLKVRSNIKTDEANTDSLKQNRQALQKSREQMTSLSRLHTWKENELNDENDDVYYYPSQFNDTNFTGKNVKVGVIDTGIDIHHADLQKNYKGGYDLVDLDDEPDETRATEGLPTLHGTHVSGIIAADGELKGVAPDADIYAYRALGPGGVGTSIHVIAAIEEAIKDGMDIINLSLGNTINGPDYPTSKAVNEAKATFDVAVVVANGNAGPKSWTVGAPATAVHALSVGAYESESFTPYLYERSHDKQIAIAQPSFAKRWDLTRDYPIELATKTDGVRGAIALLSLDDTLTKKKVETLLDNDPIALLISGNIANNEEKIAFLEQLEISVPLAFISERDARWIEKRIDDESLYVETKQKLTGDTIANFSSRGPVTVNWSLKPDLIAPGVQIASTVPDGYAALNGTSMAAPHIAGAVAVMKEANPSWTNEQIYAALKTTTEKLTDGDGMNLAPSAQGTGLVQLSEAIQTETLIYGMPLSFDKFTDNVEEHDATLTFENMSNERQTYTFHIPKQKQGYIWDIPQKFTVEPGEKKEVSLTLKINSLLADPGVYEGWLTVERNDGKVYDIPYMFIAQTADYPKLMGFTFRMHEFDEKKYRYEMYVAEATTSLEVHLYDRESLVYKGKLFEWKDLEQGLHKGEIRKDKIEQRGTFYALIIVQLENGVFINYDTNITLE